MNRTALIARLSACVLIAAPAACPADELAPPAWADSPAVTRAQSPNPVGYNDPYGIAAANGQAEPYGTYDAYTGELLRPAATAAPAATPVPAAARPPVYGAAVTQTAATAPAPAPPAAVTQVACPTGDCGPAHGGPVHPGPVYHAPVHAAPTTVFSVPACGAGAPACGVGGCAVTVAPRKGAYLFAQTEAVFLFPILDGLHNELFCEAYTPFAVNNSFTRASDDFDDLVVAPRFTAGVRKGCWGAAFRYFEVQQNANTFVPFGAVGNTTTFGTTNFDLFTVDLEAQRYFDFCDADGVAFFGVRHGEFDSFQSLANQEEFFGEIFSTSSVAQQGFSGTGLTFGTQGTRRLFCSGFHLFGGVRGSVLFGDTHNAANAFVHASGVTAAGYPVPPTGRPTTDPSQADFEGSSYAVDAEDELFILEVQLGGEYRFPLKCLCADAFIRAAFEYQYWNATGAIAGAFADVRNPNGYASAGAISTGLNLDLIGFSLGSGLTW